MATPAAADRLRRSASRRRAGRATLSAVHRTPALRSPGAALLAVAVGLALAASATAPAGARSPGADGRFETRRSAHFVLRQDVDLDAYHGRDGSRAFEREVLALLEEGHDALDARLGLRPPRPLEVHVWDAGIFDARFAALFPFPAAGFYGGTIHVRGDVAVTGPLRGTLLHELVHATLDAVAPSLGLPAWLNEGLAEWFASRARGGGGHLPRNGWNALAAAAQGGSLPPLSALSGPTLGRLDARRAGLVYRYAHGLVDFVARRHGEADLRRVVERMVRSGHVERSFRRTLRTTPAELDAEFRRELGGR